MRFGSSSWLQSNIRQALTLLLTLAVLLPLSQPISAAEPSPEREFIMSCTYGVLAGTLVGAASLAFTDKPGDNLKYVARGASLGLYVGISLGVYTVYILPKQLEKEEDRILEGETREDAHIPRWLVFPLVADNGQVDGAGAFITALTF